MPTLHLPDVPEDLFRRLRELARSEKRPVAKQAILLLEWAMADSPVSDARKAAILEGIVRRAGKLRSSRRPLPPAARPVRQERER